MGNLADVLGVWMPVLYLVASLLVVYAAYYAVKVFLSRLRLRGLISKRSEETIKLASLITIAVIVIPVAVSAVVPHPLVPTVSLAISIMVIAVILFSIMGYLTNALSYLLIALTSTLKDGEYVRVLVEGREYEGRVQLVEGNYVVLRSESGVSVHIPYSRLLGSVIVRLSQLPLVLLIRVSKPGSNLDEVIGKVYKALRTSKLIDKNSVSVRPVEVSEDVVVLEAEVETMNPRNVGECYEELVRTLIKELPYKVSIEIVGTRNSFTR